MSDAIDGERPMSDHLDRAAEALWEATCPDGLRAAMRPDCWAMAQALDADGLLVSPERDAGVAAKALREAANTFARFANSASTSERSRHGWESARGVLLRMAEEREAGESDADA